MKYQVYVLFGEFDSESNAISAYRHAELMGNQAHIINADKGDFATIVISAEGQCLKTYCRDCRADPCRCGKDVSQPLAYNGESGRNPVLTSSGDAS